jgi:hypothetical protein
MLPRSSVLTHAARRELEHERPAAAEAALRAGHADPHCDQVTADRVDRDGGINVAGGGGTHPRPPRLQCSAAQPVGRQPAANPYKIAREEVTERSVRYHTAVLSIRAAQQIAVARRWREGGQAPARRGIRNARKTHLCAPHRVKPPASAARKRLELSHRYLEGQLTWRGVLVRSGRGAVGARRKP